MITETNYDDKSDWDKEIPRIQRDLNTSVCKTTGKTPFESLYGYIPRFEEGLSRQLTSSLETYKISKEIQDEIRKNIEEEQSKFKKRYDRNRLKGVKYFVGDIVYTKAKTKSTGESTKLQYRYRGPYVITGVLNNDTYKVEKLTKAANSNKKHITTVHVSDLKIWRGIPNEDDINSDDSDFDESQIGLDKNPDSDTENNLNEAKKVKQYTQRKL